MSLVSLVLRNLTALALSGKTLAGLEVRSSLLVPITEMQVVDPVPMIAVFTDRAKADDADIDGSDMLGSRGQVTLALELACITKVKVKDEANGDIEFVETDIPASDEGMEMVLDIIQRQSLAELQSGDSVWASLWRECRIKVRAIVVERGTSIEKGSRIAARRVEIHLQVLGEPVPGKPLTAFWTRLLAAFEADPRMATMAVMLRDLIEGRALPEWRQWQAELGMSDGAIGALRLGALDGSDGTGATVATNFAIDDQDLDVPLTVPAGG